ncbi:unnamed protein product [Parajaminaea phylloscopi]
MPGLDHPATYVLTLKPLKEHMIKTLPFVVALLCVVAIPTAAQQIWCCADNSMTPDGPCHLESSKCSLKGFVTCTDPARYC